MTTKHNPRLPGYFFVEALGSGSYGTVYKARTTSKLISFVAIKCISRSSLTKSGKDNLITEIEVLKKLKHPNIVELVDFQWDDHYVFLIMELCGAGDLSKFLRSQLEKRVSERQTREFTRQLCAALEFMSSKNICHMDLKPHNILLTYFMRSTGHTKASGGAAALGVGARLEPRLKIADFGFAKHMDREGGNEDDTLRGSYLYMAPEVLTHRDYSDKCDLWSLGVIIYECLTSTFFIIVIYIYIYIYITLCVFMCNCRYLLYTYFSFSHRPGTICLSHSRRGHSEDYATERNPNSHRPEALRRVCRLLVASTSTGALTPHSSLRTPRAPVRRSALSLLQRHRSSPGRTGSAAFHSAQNVSAQRAA